MASESESAQSDPADMDLEQLREEYQDLQEEIDFFGSFEQQSDLFDRLEALWSELRSRVDVERPECPKCDAQRWGQTPGDPVYCRNCSHEVASADLEEAVHDAWNQIIHGKEVSDDGE